MAMSDEDFSYSTDAASQKSPQENERQCEPVYEVPPPNPLGGKTLVVDQSNPQRYPRPSAAIQDAGPDDQIFVCSGIYEDRIFIAEQPIQLIGAGRNQVQIFSRKSGPLYLQRCPRGIISGITFRYVGSDQHLAMNILDSTCTISYCRAKEGILSGIVIYGPQSRPTLMHNEVCFNRESGIFSFAGAQPYISNNLCYANHHFGLAVRDDGTCPDLKRNVCRNNMLSGILLFHRAQALLVENVCKANQHWGLVLTPDCQTTPATDQLVQTNMLVENPRGEMVVTHEPLAEIGR
ncbi:MAG: hypothetical protein GKS05_01605 [Nitrospirales bacterium]|nr:hypothetical protein [Nitrospirales bacterium]